MSEPPTVGQNQHRHPRRPLQLWALAALIAVEALALIVVVGVLVVDLFTAPADSIISAIALTGVTAIGAVWLVVMALHTVQGRPWIRAAAVTVQVLLIALALGSFQGVFARPDIGWLLLAPAIVGLALLFTRPVINATRRA